MNFTGFLLNLAFLGFTCLILMTDGLPKNLAYFLFTLILLLVPVLNLVMIFLASNGKGWFSLGWKGKKAEEMNIPEGKYATGKIITTVALISNLTLMLLSAFAYMDQYPHPREDGFMAFILFLIVTPVISIIVIWRNGSKIIRDNMNSRS